MSNSRESNTFGYNSKPELPFFIFSAGIKFYILLAVDERSMCGEIKLYSGLSEIGFCIDSLIEVVDITNTAESRCCEAGVKSIPNS